MSGTGASASGRDPSLEVIAAREQTRQQLGAAVGEKASDRFCVAFASRAGEPFGALLEAAPASAAEVPTVIEFSAPEQAAMRLPDHVEESAASDVWASVGDIAEDLASSEKAVSLLLRLVGVKTRKDDFLRTAGPVRAELERTTSVLANRARRGVERGGVQPAVQTCWLNRTLRATADPRALSEVAGDPAVEAVDVPVLLQPEAVELSATLQAAATARTNHGLTGSGVTVGVLDSEVALRHPAFQERVIQQHNYTREPFGTPGTHGTAVAGIVGADGDGFAGIAPGCTIYNYKVIATIPALNSDDFEGALAIQQALEDGVRVVNCSWGPRLASGTISREARACDTAWALGMTVVKSAGNRGPDASTLTTPAEADGVIVVGATDPTGVTLQDYSSRGPTPAGAQRPHLLAPGGSEADGLNSALIGGGFGDVTRGTSFAAPHVAGLIALLLEQQPELTPDEQRTLLLNACDLLPGVDASAQGAGLISPQALFG